jgi:hypothetical protein
MLDLSMRSMLALGLAFCSGLAAAAEVYRSVDEHGNVVYSDQPSPGAELIKAPPISTISLPPIENAQEPTAPAAPPPKQYLSFAIIAPTQDATVRDNTGAVQVGLLVEPSIDRERGHRLQLFLDGKPLGEPGLATEIGLTDVDRGTHELKAVIIDREGRSVASTQTVTFHLHRESQLFRRGAP